MGKLWVGEFFMLFVFASTILCFGADNTSSRNCFEHERRALLRFKRSLDPPGLLSSWTGNNCCQWQNVSCDNATGHVTRLDLGYDFPTSQLQGSELDSSLSELTRLSYLDLSGIQFRSSPIPEFIGSMTQLRFLNLSYAGFSGVVPQSIGSLSSLRELSLSHMDLVVDDFTWLSSLLALEHLDLSGLSFSEARNLDQVLLHMISSLRSLLLAGCKLSNSHFKRIHLDSNITLSTIQTLDLSGNLLEGDFPLFLQNLTSLRVLDLSFNRLNASIPVMNGILELYLTGNRFLGFQDIGVWRLCRMKVLEISLTNMGGELRGPSTQCAQFALEELYLNSNKFSGEVPTCLQRLTALKVLNLNGNELTGSIPETLGSLLSLRELVLMDIFHYAKIRLHHPYKYKNTITRVYTQMGHYTQIGYMGYNTNTNV